MIRQGLKIACDVIGCERMVFVQATWEALPEGWYVLERDVRGGVCHAVICSDHMLPPFKSPR